MSENEIIQTITPWLCFPASVYLIFNLSSAIYCTLRLIEGSTREEIERSIREEEGLVSRVHDFTTIPVRQITYFLLREKDDRNPPPRGL